MSASFKNARIVSTTIFIAAIIGGFGMGGCAKISEPPKSSVPVVEAPKRETIMSIPLDGMVTVGKDDTIYTIAARYQVSPRNIVEDNDIGPPYILTEGQRLRLTPPRFHMVFPGDTPTSIAERYGVSETQLATANGKQEPLQIVIGERLILPAEPELKIGGNAEEAPVSPSSGGSTVAAATPAPPKKRFVAPTTGGPFRWPVSGEVITEFGPAERGVHNDGINIAAAAGTEIVASAPGTVAFIGKEIKSFGTLVLIKHKDGIITAYAHLGEVMVAEGDIVSAGQPIANVGQTGKVDTPQLHFEIRKSRRPIDPRSLIS